MLYNEVESFKFLKYMKKELVYPASTPGSAHARELRERSNTLTKKEREKFLTKAYARIRKLEGRR